MIRAPRASLTLSIRCVAAAIVALLTVSSCGSGEPSLRGITRDDPLDVGALHLTEVVVGAEGTLTTRPFAMRAATGELLVVYFGFTNCPDLCPATLADVRAATTRLDPRDQSRLSVAMVTVDPARDTPEVLVNYLSAFTNRPHPLRPESDAELQAAEAAFLASSRITPLGPDTVDVAHTTITYVVDAQGRVLVEWPFGTSIDDLTADLETLFTRLDRSES